MSLKIALGGDHAGFQFKKKLLEFLTSKGYTAKDYGTDSEESVDYPDYVHPLSMSVANGQYELGILICGSGNGVCMTANKHDKIRAALCWNEELAALARQHNNANVLCLPARFVDYDVAEKIVEAFLTSEFEGGRHSRRVQKISS
ncbi:MAG: ribose 5-phosphate isomerase B [Bacteroidota bacterium]